MDGETLKGYLMALIDPRVGVQINTFIWYGKVNGTWPNKNTNWLLLEQQSIRVHQVINFQMHF